MMAFNSDNTSRDPRQRLQSSAFAPTNQGGPGNPMTANNMPRDPFQQYGYSGQSPSLGRYVPPMMQDRNQPQNWFNQGGYAYNIPNSYGNPQYTQFNAMGQPSQNFGQSPNVPPPMPQLQPAQRELLTMFAGLPGMSSVTDPYREQLRPPVPQMQANYGMPQMDVMPVGGMNKPITPGMEYTQGPGGKRLDADSDGYGGDNLQGSTNKNLFSSIGNGLRRAGNWVRNELNDPNPTVDIRGMLPNLGGLFNRSPGGGAPPQGGGSGSGSGSPGLGPTAGGGGYMPYRPSWAGDAPAPQPSYGPLPGPTPSGTGEGPLPYTVPNYGGGGGGSGLGPTPGGGAPPMPRRAPRSTRFASAYRLNASREGMNALRDQAALDAMGLHNYSNRQR